LLGIGFLKEKELLKLYQARTGSATQKSILPEIRQMLLLQPPVFLSLAMGAS
jgi:hypothetical protein